MNTPPLPILACGPSGGLVILIYAVFGAGALCLFSFIWGAVCVFTGNERLGLGLVSFSACLTVALLLWLRIL